MLKFVPVCSGLLLVVTMASGCSGLQTGPDTALQPQAFTVSFDPPSADFDGLQVGRLEQWSGALASGGRVEIINPWGDVYIRHNRGGERVGLSATIQRLGNPAAEEQIRILTGPDRVRMEVAYPHAAVPAPGFNRVGRVDIAVLVPQGSLLEVHTSDGLISGKRMRSDVLARSTSGNIHLSTSGWVDAASESGTIELVMVGEGWSRPIRASTAQGDVSVDVPVATSVRVRARGPGGVDLEPEPLREALAPAPERADGLWGDPATANELVVESGEGRVRVSLYGTLRDAPLSMRPDDR